MKLANLLNYYLLCLQAVAMRDTLARALYGALFDWIVDQVELIIQLYMIAE